MDTNVPAVFAFAGDQLSSLSLPDLFRQSMVQQEWSHPDKFCPHHDGLPQHVRRCPAKEIELIICNHQSQLLSLPHLLRQSIRQPEWSCPDRFRWLTHGLPQQVRQ
jgi:hypothetical protein